MKTVRTEDAGVCGMNEIATIKRHEFEIAKNRLKEFSETKEAELAIKKVRTEGDFFGLGGHRVTGGELNKRLAAIQQHFITVNTTTNKVIKEFREIYNALDLLDKDYIASIVANVQAIEKTSNDVRRQQAVLQEHHVRLAAQQNKLDTHQSEIEKSIEVISKIVIALHAFQDRLTGYSHLADIDELWEDCEEMQKELRTVSDSFAKLSKKTAEELRAVQHKQQTFSARVHGDIFGLRNELKALKASLSSLEETVESAVGRMAVEEQTDDGLADALEQQQRLTDEKIAQAVEPLRQKLRYACWIAGGSAGLAVIALILLLTKVI